MKFVLKELPYGFGDLKGLFTEDQLKTHYTKHHQAYCDNFNKALEEFSLNGDESVLDILNNVSKYNQAVLNNGGGY